jgi:membrane-bound serine protease (ClpP class)
MRPTLRRLVRIVPLLVFLVSGLVGAAGRGKGRVAEAVVTGAIDPGSGAYLASALTRAEAGGYEALVVRLDTPGGLVSTTREIVERLFAARVPVLVFVGPEGARAGSAGVFITLASHVAAMAPATNIGAAHPVSIGPKAPRESKESKETGEKPGVPDDEAVMRQKVENDLVAFARSIAEERGRNVEWAVQAVRESASITAREAREKGVVDLVVPDVAGLLAEADGRTVRLGPAKEERVLHLRGLPVDELPWGLQHRFLHLIGDPNIASLLLSLGSLGLLLEFYKPGAMVPGVLGALMLLFGAVGMSALPVNVGGLALLVLGIALFIAELFVTSHGLLGVSGAVAFAAGSVLLIDTTDPRLFADKGFGVRLSAVLPTTALMALFAVWVGVQSVRAWRRRPVVGVAGLVGERAVVETTVGPETTGWILLQGERWKAFADVPLAPSRSVRVTAVDGLVVRVEAAD